MDERRNAAQEWLETAVKGIRFGPDREAVEAELREHLEDKTADMARIFHIEGEEAEREALKRMGDPEEIGRELARLHKPWLGWLWQTSRVLRIILLIWAVFYMLYGTDHYGDAVIHEAHYDPPMAVEPAQVKLGGYTFRIARAELDDYGLQVAVRGSSPRFWERIVIPISRITVVTPNGRRFRADMEGTSENSLFIVVGDRWGVFYRDCRIMIHGASCQPGDWIKVELAFPTEMVELSAQVGER